MATFRRKTLCRRSSPGIYQGILIYLHTIVRYYNILSKFNCQVAGLKVKVAVVMFRKKKHFMIALAPSFINGL